MGPPEAERERDRERESFSFLNSYKKNSKKSAARWERELNARKDDPKEETNHKCSNESVEKNVKKEDSVVVCLVNELFIFFAAAVWVHVVEREMTKLFKNEDLCIVEIKVFKIGFAFCSSVFR